MMTPPDGIRFELNGAVANEALNALYADSWPAHETADLVALLPNYLAWVCAYDGARLLGWAYLASDGWQHAFLLDPTVHPEYRRQGIGTELVRRLTEAARQAGCSVLHVDYEAELAPFYARCGFTPTAAGLINL
jgi:GNAT superfamily N-acetyltransferase